MSRMTAVEQVDRATWLREAVLNVLGNGRKMASQSLAATQRTVNERLGLELDEGK